ncbi:MAG: site-specific integrase [Bacteroidales bacterium]|jgi:integrase
MNITPKINTHYIRKDGKHQVRLAITRNSERAYFNTDFNVFANDWDEKKHKAKDKRENADTINFKINEKSNEIEKFLIDKPELSLKTALKLFSQGTIHGKGLSFIEFVQNFINDCEKGKYKREKGTIKNYKGTLNHVKDFDVNVKAFDFTTLNKDLYDCFTFYLRSEKKLAENSVGKIIKNIKSFINEAIEQGITNTTEHRKKYFKKPSEEPDTIYLNTEEIEIISNLNLSKHPHLSDERDRFIISYYLLLRYSDSITINEGNIFKQDGQYFFRKQPQKTKQHNNEVVVPVKPIVLEILKKNEFNLKANTNQEANWKLKEIGKLAELDIPVEVNGKTFKKYELITTHTARRSGATNLFLQKVPVKIIMDLGGWKTEKSFMLYIRADKIESAKMAADYEFFK